MREQEGDGDGALDVRAIAVVLDLVDPVGPAATL
jgi:hypothetical protein